MSKYHNASWQAVRIPFRLVEAVYGNDNEDNAGDDLIYALDELSEYPDQYDYRFADDATHPNPWYHAMIFEIEGVPDEIYKQLLEKIAALGLSEEKKPEE